MRNFDAEVKGLQFEFRTMNVREWKLFQVYVTIDGVKKRFHMHSENGVFRIADPFDAIKGLDKQLADIIEQQKNNSL